MGDIPPRFNYEVLGVNNLNAALIMALRGRCDGAAG
jgi:hypothetical protein